MGTVGRLANGVGCCSTMLCPSLSHVNDVAQVIGERSENRFAVQIRPELNHREEVLK